MDGGKSRIHQYIHLSSFRGCPRIQYCMITQTQEVNQELRSTEPPPGTTKQRHDSGKEREAPSLDFTSSFLTPSNLPAASFLNHSRSLSHSFYTRVPHHSLTVALSYRPNPQHEAPIIAPVLESNAARQLVAPRNAYTCNQHSAVSLTKGVLQRPTLSLARVHRQR